MSEQQRKAFFRRTVIGLWAMVTLVLIFCVALLLNELASQGYDPFELPEPATAIASTTAVPGLTETREFEIYFADSEGRMLVAERQRAPYTGYTADTCRALLERLIQGPRSSDLIPVLPPESAIRGLYILDRGELVIDFSREVEQGLARSASAEGLMVYGIVNTLAQPGLGASGEPRIERVRFLFEGAAPDRFPRHVDLKEPVAPSPEWIGSGRPTADADD